MHTNIYIYIYIDIYHLDKSVNSDTGISSLFLVEIFRQHPFMKTKDKKNFHSLFFSLFLILTG